MKFSKLYIVAALLLVLAGTGSAAPLCLQTTNLLDLVNLAADGCTIDDKLFANFNVLGQLSAATVAVETGVAASGNHFLTFISGAFTVTGGFGDIFDATIFYTVTSLSGATITDLHLRVGSFTANAPGSSITVTETACFGINFACGTPDVTLTASPNGIADEVFAPQTSLTVFKRVAVTAEAGNVVTLDSVTNEVSQTQAAPIPEPGTWVFMSTGLMGLAFVQRRLRRPT